MKKREVLGPSVSRGWAQVPEWRRWPPGSGQGSPSSPMTILRVAGVGRKGCLLGAWVLKIVKPLPAKGAARPDSNPSYPLPAPLSSLTPGVPGPRGGGQSLVLTLNWGRG